MTATKINRPGESPRATVAQASTELHGTGASGGVVTGRARVLSAAQDGALVQAGDVVIFASGISAWTPLSEPAAGVVAEAGGGLCNLAIIARECGIPAVVAVRDAATRLRDGQVVRIDGSSGTVSILS